MLLVDVIGELKKHVRLKAEDIMPIPALRAVVINLKGGVSATLRLHNTHLAVAISDSTILGHVALERFPVNVDPKTVAVAIISHREAIAL